MKEIQHKICMLFRPIFRKALPHFFRPYFSINRWWHPWQIATAWSFLSRNGSLLIAHDEFIIIITKRKCFESIFFFATWQNALQHSYSACVRVIITRNTSLPQQRKNPSKAMPVKFNFACYVSIGEICKFQPFRSNNCSLCQNKIKIMFNCVINSNSTVSFY